MPAPNKVLRLIENFDTHIEHYKSQNYNETQLRREFLDPFFESLGWDIDNKRGYAPAYKEVIHEDAIKISGSTKAPDYCFRIGGQRKFFLEAKKPAINVKTGRAPAFQLRRYAWSAKLPLSILSDFEEFAVYDCRIRPFKTDKATKARTLYFTYLQFENSWDEIASIFSQEAILKGSFDKYVATKKKGTVEVDDAFLVEIERWRERLARSLALRNMALSARDLNFAVQKIIDRIIFLRICEDRGTEDYGRLMALESGRNVYNSLLDLFRHADARYNSGLFHFSKESGRLGAPDLLTPELQIDDLVLKDIIRNLYSPDSPYEFSVLPADILGQVYEQFLGKTIRLTAQHHAKVEEKPAVRKAGGVYYTPSYIVDHIVKNTLGSLLNGPDSDNPKPIPVSQASKIKVLDPASGSGSFLIVAYQYLLDWHRDQYSLDPENGEIDKGKIRRHAGGKYPKIYLAPGGEYRLTTIERKRILLNSIHGVDIDYQAVEVTKLSLLLKVLEGETQEDIQRDFLKERERILPDLGENIQCGNSLIESDFYNQPDFPELDDESHYRINVFDWQKAFPEVFEQGGFTCVVGNPPWGASVHELSVKYLANRYSRSVDRMTDTYVYFLDRALSLLTDNGLLGFVIPSTLLNQSDTRSIRRLLLSYGIHQLINLGAGVFGKGATNTTTLIIAGQNKATNKIYLQDAQSYSVLDKPKALESGSKFDAKSWAELARNDPLAAFFVSDVNAAILLSKLRRKLPPLSSLLKGKIQRGVTPDFAEMHLIKEANEDSIEADILRKSILGNQIKRYANPRGNQYLIYTTKSTDIGKFPKANQHLSKFKNKITCKEVARGKHPWWALHRPRNPEIFNSPKFIGLTTTREIEIIFDKDENLVVTDACYVFAAKDGYEPRFILGLFHSKIMRWMYRVANQGDGRVIPQVKAATLSPLPVCAINFDDPNEVTKHNRIASLVTEMCTLVRQASKEGNPENLRFIKSRMRITECQIDHEVYNLYGLNPDEIELIESST